MDYKIAQFFIYVHEAFGLCFWNFFALILALIVVVVFGIHHYKHKKREKDFEKEMEQSQQVTPAVEA